jgi:hypothetical protein
MPQSEVADHEYAHQLETGLAFPEAPGSSSDEEAK